MLTFRKNYFVLTLLLFAIEALIAVFVHDRIIRPYVGDVLVVILMYCFFKSFLNLSMLATATGVLVFAFLIEFLQFWDITGKLGLTEYKIACIIIGNSFAWLDIVAYVCGFLLILLVEKACSRKNKLNLSTK